MTRQFELELVGLTDAESVRRAEAAIRGNTGVTSVRVYPTRGRAFVETSRDVYLEHLVESLESAGFMARLAQDDED